MPKIGRRLKLKKIPKMFVVFGQKTTVRCCKAPIRLKQYYDIHKNHLQTILPLTSPSIFQQGGQNRDKTVVANLITKWPFHKNVCSKLKLVTVL